MEFYWLAQLDDGTMMENTHRYGEIRRDKLFAFAIVNKATGLPVLTLHLDPSRRLFYRRRTRISSNGQKTVIHIAGWTDALGSRVVCAIPDDGHVEITSYFDEHHPYFYSIEFMPEEK